MRRLVVTVVLLLAVTGACAQDRAVSFNLSSNKTFAPGEQPKIHLYTHNVDALEFRVYRVNDSVKFMENLRELHSFGHEEGFGGQEQIDERSWLEKFHDWKDGIWESIRDFFRHQFSHHARSQLRGKQSSIQRHSRIVQEAEFAQIPVLNQSQLVARWRQLVPATFISDQNELPVPKLSAGLYLVEATNGRYKAYTLLMVTDMALVTRATPGKILGFVVDRVSGKPIAGVKVDAGFGQKAFGTAATDANGVATIQLPPVKGEQDNFWVIAHQGNNVAVATPYTWSLTSDGASTQEGYAFTERPVYRPTHTVHWKAILRMKRDNLLVLPNPGKVHVTINDQTDKTVFDAQLPLSAAGEVHGDYTLPKDAALGYYSIRIGDPPNSVSTGFHVEDYRKPEYRVQVSAAQKRVLEGQTMAVTIDSRYFFGEPVANAKVKYRIYHERHYWWSDEDSSDSSPDEVQPDADSENTNSAFYGGEEEAEQTGKLDANGKLTIQVPTRVDDTRQHGDFDYTVEAGVTDAANREITGRGRFLATYGTFRINIEPVSYAVHSGETAKFRVTATDYDDKPVSTRVHVQLVYRHYENGRTDTTEAAATDITTDDTGKATGELPVMAPKYSSAELEATADPTMKGTRSPSDETSLWILGVGEQSWQIGSDNAQIISDKKSYAPGDTAHLSIVSGTDGFYALVIVEGSSEIMRQVMHSDGKTVSFDLPITAESQPNINVSVIFLRNNTLYQASKVIKVPPTQQKLQVQITPAKDVFQPQQTVSYDVQTTDASGKPVSADVSFGVVDEAIYSLYPDSSGDMISRLYPQRYATSQVDSSLDFYFSGEAGEKSPMLAMRNARYRPQLAQVKPGNEAKPRVRKAFPDTAFWAPDIHTDSSGHAHVSFAFPDSLTTWRATVHAITADSKAGSTISRVLVRKNVLVRMGTPRFMIQGDEIVLPVITHNYLDTAKQATISLKAEGLDTISGSQQSVTIPSKGESTVLYRLRASKVGTAKLTASAITDAESDALELSFPVEPAGVKKSLASSGVVAQNGAQATANITFPSNTDPAAHTLRVELSPSVAGSLFSALDYLTTYPYGCTEQTMSSFLPNVIVAGTLSKLNVQSRVNPADLHDKMEAGLDRLKDYQHDDGGWGWWKEDDSRVFMTAYVVGGIGMGSHYIQLNGDQRAMLESGEQYLRRQLAAHPRMRPELRASVIYALSQADSTNLAAAIDTEWERRKDLEPEGMAMLGLAMKAVQDPRAAQAAQLLASEAQHQGDLVFWKGSYAPFVDDYFDNDAEATAQAVRLISMVDPSNALLGPAVQWLMLARNGGVWWDSTEQTAMTIFGLTDYLAATHEFQSDFTADLLVNGHSVGQHHFTPADVASGATFAVEIDAAHLQPGSNVVQVMRRGGSGRIYWSARGEFYSTQKSDFQAGTMKLNLTRDYFKLEPEQKNGRVMYRLVPLHGQAQVGDLLAVHEAINGSKMRYLMLEDPIPAGAEFVSNQDSYEIDQRPDGWTWWFTRQEFHDDHAAFFATDFDGRQEIFYLLRVVNPGSFHISPSRVEPMYQPGVQATSDALELQVPAPAGGAQ